MHADHLPVVLTDCASFRHARAGGVILEYLPDADTWERHRPGVPWDDLLTDRLARLFRDHGCVLPSCSIRTARPPWPTCWLEASASPRALGRRCTYVTAETINVPAQPGVDRRWARGRCSLSRRRSGRSGGAPGGGRCWCR